jgi:ribosomal protein L28
MDTREALGLPPLRPGFGRHVRHQHSGRWERKAPKRSKMFQLNAHRRRLFIDGRWVTAKVTTRELRTLLKHAR